MRWRDGIRLGPVVLGNRWQAASPYKLLLSLTDRCTHRCRHCATWRRDPGDELTPDEVDRLLASAAGLRWLDLTGGEITARPDFLELAGAVAAHAGRLIFLHFATSGSDPGRVLRLTERLCAASGPAVVVTVSLDGDEPLHDHIRGRKGAFASAVDTARRLHRLPGVEVYLGTTLTPDNADHLERIRAALRSALPELADSRWHVNVMNRSRHFFGNADHPLPDREQVLAFTRFVERARGRSLDPFAAAERLFLRTLRWYLRQGTAPLPCQALKASVFVSPSGQAFPCHILDWPLGDLRALEMDLQALMRSPAARAARARIVRERCSRCWTPCEAYHAMLAAPMRTLIRSLERAAC